MNLFLSQYGIHTKSFLYLINCLCNISLYCNVKVPNHQKRVINNLSKHEDIVIMKQDKGRGVMIMDKTKYSEKCLELLSTKQFQTLNFDPTKSTELKVQRMLRKIKSKLPIQDYKHLYPTGSYPGKFYWTAKLHKIEPNGHVDRYWYSDL